MKKLIFAVICAFVGVVAHADAMYWQLAGQNITGLSDPNCWTMARIEVYSGGEATGTYLHYLDDHDIEYMDKNETGAWFDVDMSNYPSVSPEYSFVLELVNDDLQIQAATTPVSYSSLSDKIVSESTFNSISPLNYSTYNAGANTTADLPEPTSGLLMLLGASLLALRRRQA